MLGPVIEMHTAAGYPQGVPKSAWVGGRQGRLLGGGKV